MPAGRGHSNHHPIERARCRPPPRSVSGAKRSAKRRPNVPACRATSFTSTIGPTTMNASRAVSENCGEAGGDEGVGLGADGHHHRQPGQGQDRRAGPASATASRTRAGHHGLQGGGGRRPDDEEPAGVEEVVLGGRRRRRRAAVRRRSWRRRARSSRSSRPRRAHSSPTRVAASRLARNRASDDLRPARKGDRRRHQHDRVDGGRRQQEREGGRGRRAPGDQPPGDRDRPHSQPGSADPGGGRRPARPAPGRWGRSRGRRPAGTKAATTALMLTPRTRNGIAWTVMATNTSPSWRPPGGRGGPRAADGSSAAATTTTATTATPTSGRRARAGARRSRRRAGTSVGDRLAPSPASVANGCDARAR